MNNLDALKTAGVERIKSFRRAWAERGVLQPGSSMLRAMPWYTGMCPRGRGSWERSPSPCAPLTSPAPGTSQPLLFSLHTFLRALSFRTQVSSSPALLSCGGSIPVQSWSLEVGTVRLSSQPHGTQVTLGCLTNLRCPWDTALCWLTGRRGEVTNESQKCCSGCTVSVTGLQSRSENNHRVPASLRLGAAPWQPTSSWGKWSSHSHYFMACQQNSWGKRQAGCPAFHP